MPGLPGSYLISTCPNRLANFCVAVNLDLSERHKGNAVNHKIMSYHKNAMLRIKLANRSCYAGARCMSYNDRRDKEKECMYDDYQNDFPKKKHLVHVNRKK